MDNKMDNKLTLEEYKNMKRELGEQIKNICNDFEEKTGCFINDLTIDRISGISGLKLCNIININVETKI